MMAFASSMLRCWTIYNIAQRSGGSDERRTLRSRYEGWDPTPDYGSFCSAWSDSTIALPTSFVSFEVIK